MEPTQPSLRYVQVQNSGHHITQVVGSGLALGQRGGDGHVTEELTPESIVEVTDQVDQGRGQGQGRRNRNKHQHGLVPGNHAKYDDENRNQSQEELGLSKDDRHEADSSQGRILYGGVRCGG